MNKIVHDIRKRTLTFYLDSPREFVWSRQENSRFSLIFRPEANMTDIASSLYSRWISPGVISFDLRPIDISSGSWKWYLVWRDSVNCTSWLASGENYVDHLLCYGCAVDNIRE